MLVIWMHRLVDIEGDLKREAAGREPPALNFGSRSCTECEFENGCAKCNPAYFPTATDGLETRQLGQRQRRQLQQHRRQQHPRACNSSLNPAMRRKMVLTRLRRPVGSGTQKIRRRCSDATNGLTYTWMSIHGARLPWPVHDASYRLRATNMTAARRRPLAEVVVWNGRALEIPADKGRETQSYRVSSQPLCGVILTFVPHVLFCSNLAPNVWASSAIPRGLSIARKRGRTKLSTLRELLGKPAPNFPHLCTESSPQVIGARSVSSQMCSRRPTLRPRSSQDKENKARSRAQK